MKSKITQKLIEVCSQRPKGQYYFDCYMFGMCRVWWDGKEWQAHMTPCEKVENLEEVAVDLFNEMACEFDEEELV